MSPIRILLCRSGGFIPIRLSRLHSGSHEQITRQLETQVPSRFILTEAEKLTKIVLVDDDPQILETLVLLLSAGKHETACFISAEELLSSSDKRDCDCLLIDLGLPGMDGCELVKELRKLKIFTPVILLSGKIDDEVVSQLREVPAVTLLNKPCRGPQLLDAVSAVIRK